MFDFVNDDDRIIMTGVAVMVLGLFLAVVVGVRLLVSLVRVLTKFSLSRRKLSIAEGQNRRIGIAAKYDVFISYSHQDEENAGWLAKILEGANVRVFYSASRLLPGDNFSDQVQNALRDAAELWVLISPFSLQSEWVMTEWGAAWAMGKRVVPVLHGCKVKQLPPRLAELQAVPFDQVASELPRLKKRLIEEKRTGG